MHCLPRSKCRIFLLQTIKARSFCTPTSTDIKELCNVISSGIGSLDDLELSLNQCNIALSSSVVTQVIDSCKNEAPSRRLLRFFSWCKKNMNFDLGDEHFNHMIQVCAQKKDFTALDILISDLGNENRAMKTHTFGVVVETLVKLGREDEALGIFKNLEKFKCDRDEVTVSAIVSALCVKGHARKAEGVVYHHKDKILGAESCIYKSLLYGWSFKENVDEARKIIKEMKSSGMTPDLYCFNTFLSCLCKRNLKSNPSGLVPEALNVMMEMRTYGVAPTSISYNILLSCLSKTRRVKESVRILDSMKNSGCSPDWVTYYLVARVLYLSGRFGKGNQMVDRMIEENLTPNPKFYYDLIGVLCGVERPDLALELFEKMKQSFSGGYGLVYDLLIPKLCRGGDFVNGRMLWDEAKAMGVSLSCDSDVLDPEITKVFKPVRKVDDDDILDFITNSNRKTITQTKETKRMYLDNKYNMRKKNFTKKKRKMKNKKKMSGSA